MYPEIKNGLAGCLLLKVIHEVVSSCCLGLHLCLKILLCGVFGGSLPSLMTWSFSTLQVTLSRGLSHNMIAGFPRVSDPRQQERVPKTDATVFLYLTSEVTSIDIKSKGNKGKINKWDYNKPKSFCTAKETINKMKSQPMKREKINAKHIS